MTFFYAIIIAYFTTMINIWTIQLWYNNLCKIENCQICENKMEWFQYKWGYYLYRGKCKEKRIEECYICSTYNKCDKCLIGYKKDNYGKYVLDSKNLQFNSNLYSIKKIF